MTENGESGRAKLPPSTAASSGHRRPAGAAAAAAEPGALARIRAVLLGHPSDRVHPLDGILRSARERSELAHAAGCDAASAEAHTALTFAGDAIVALGAEGELTDADVRAAAAELASILGVTPASAAFMLYGRVLAAPQLFELPPLVAIGIQLRPLVDLRIFHEISLWRRSADGEAECLLNLGPGELGREVRREVRAVLRGSSALRVAGRSTIRSAPVWRFRQRAGAVVGRLAAADRAPASAFLHEAATAIGPILEREFLLERSRTREESLVVAAERRLTRLAFDLHDGPMQDVLALAAEVKQLQRDLDPFILESRRELARGRFDDALARLAELDRDLRETAQSLETTSTVSRPLGEVLHREAEAFTRRTGIDARVDVRGDVGALTASQRIVIFRAVQEALSNVREHSAATAAEVVVRTRRSTTEVSITDDGQGFEVARGLARAAQRGRLGVVGISERVRLLGGTFDIDSRPGGPTTLRFSLPRWGPFSAAGERRR
ncbi:Histidine kinase-, DNA gyrase B-, and HSP90-like ATPase [Gaiella occulta]|uniref:histidine kinase n=1 Tax=Gaiella occulta TaxID=1002870 RepID=A0A7M2YVE0_9ACTN|nr:ATP-binding protein [Gaiella occulta]RDI74046.1 Histidine kinase-, DNA gyrase B-, and HSP90-like ATPase [Gaiella occulta]